MLHLEVPTPPTVAPLPEVIVAPSADSWLDYLTAFGTVGAVVVAMWLGWHEVRQYRRDEVDRRRQVERGQAEQVTAWTEPYARSQIVVTPGASLARRVRDNEGKEGTVLNASALPVYEVVLLRRDAPDERIGLVPPGGRAHFPGPPVTSSTPVPVRFRDASGLWWMRDDEGQLHRSSVPSGERR
jgi:hypothetical protein